MAPTSKIFARSQTGLEKSGANSTISGNNSAGSMGIWKTSLGGKFFLSLCGLPLLFQRSKLDKVELRRMLQRLLVMTSAVGCLFLFFGCGQAGKKKRITGHY